MAQNKRLALIEKTFNSLNKSNLDILNDFYAENIAFTDPVGNIQGLAPLKKYYAHVYENVNSIHFNFHQIDQVEHTFFAKWTMQLQVKGLNSGAPYDVEGFSVIQFNAQEKVEYHRDYLDLGSMVYEKIPVLGSAIKLIKKKLA